MLVLAVLALAATVVLLTLPSGEQRVAGEADRLAVRIAALRDLAIVEGRAMAITVQPSGYGFERRVGEGWDAVPGRSFAAHDAPSGIRFAGEGAAAERIVFDALGMTDTRRTLAVSDGTVTARLRVSATGEVARGE
jgi:general secretion pathway protein H